MDGERLAERVADVGIDPESTQRWDRIDVPGGQLPELFLLYAVLTDTAGNLVSHHWSVHSTRGQEPMAGLRHLPAGEVDVKREENSLCVTNTGRSVVVGLWLEPDLDTYLSLSDNWFCLVPGETRTITITGQGSFAVSAWNIHPFTVLAR